MTDRRGNRTEYRYDSMNRLYEMKDPLLNITGYSFDAAGNLVTVTDPNNNITTYAYDNMNRSVSETDGEGYTKHYRYDWAGNKTWESTKKNEYVGTQYIYDELYRLKIVEDAEHKQTTYTYDPMNNLLTQTLGGQITVTCQYDALYRLKKKITGTLEETYDTYDASGNLKQKTDRNGISTAYAYDNLNRLLSETAGTDSRQFAYDSAGNLTSTIDETGTTTYEYNALNQLDRKILPGSKIVDYDYDAEGNNTVVTDPDNNTTNYTYDALNRLQTVTTTEGTSTYTYYANGNRETLTLPDGTVTTYQYNPRNMLTSLVNHTGGVDTTYTYQYDADGLQLYKVEPKGRTDFEYDDLGRIKKVTEPGNRITQYTYDNAGNRDTQTVDAPGLDVDINYTYNSMNWLVQTVETRNGATTTAALTYDDNGNQETVTETGPSGTRVSTYEYDNFNQLKTAQTPNGEVITSKYNASGMRIEKTVNEMTTTYHYDGANVILEETGGTHNRNIYGINLIARNDGAGALYYLYNGHEDVVKLVNASGSLVNEYDYDIFGNPLLVNESRTNPFRYAGYFFDDETEYYYLNSRYYDPKNARFITEDTYLGKYTDPLSLNLYTYCGNNPINYFDPSGNTAYALEWKENASWLPVADGPIPAGDVIYYGGYVVCLGIDYGPAAWDWTTNVAAPWVSNAANDAGDCVVDKVSKGWNWLKEKFGGSGSSTGSPNDPNKLKHVFDNSEHNLDGYLQKFDGNQDNAFNALQKATEKVISSGKITGVFEQIVKVNGFDITVRGNVVDGVVKIGTAFIP